jgi:HPt (histidine-containing phosphotransfer) domain-containing protein
VVVLSADATSGQRQRLRAHGAIDYLTKPFDIPRLLAVIDGNGSLDQPRSPSETASGPTVGEPLDPAVVASLRELGGDSTVGSAGIRDLVRTFLDDSVSRFAELRAAVRDGDVTGVERLAHTLVGSSASLGARDVAEGCRQIEARALAGDLAGVATLMPGLGEAFAVARAALGAEFLGVGDPLR